jgi:hypothetical protein
MRLAVCGLGRVPAEEEASDVAQQNDQRAYLGRKPSFTREQFMKVRSMLGKQTAGIAQIANGFDAADGVPHQGRSCGC